MDRVLTVEDWLKSYWEMQDDDLNFLKGEELRERFVKDPNGLLLEIRNRMRRRHELFQFFKHLNLHDIPENKVNDIQGKLDLLIVRENLLTELTNKILDLFERAYLHKESPDPQDGALLNLEPSSKNLQ